MTRTYAEVSTKGRVVKVPAVRVGDATVVVTGRLIKTATVKDEFWLMTDAVIDPDSVMTQLKAAKLNADLFTFSQKLPDIQQKYEYPLEWDNVAAIPTKSFAEWWEKLPQEARKNVRRSEKRKVVVKKVDFSDALVHEIVMINNETPIRQGRPFWHYGKSFDTVKKDYSDFLDRSEFLGAYYENELIGFIRLIYMGGIMNVLQLLCMNKHYDKRPANALIAKAVELCVEKGVSYLVYGQYVYAGNTNSSLTEFKRRNGFEQILIPTYYIPLTVKGRVFMKLGLHLGMKRLLPERSLSMFRELRSKIYERRILSKQPSAGSASSSADPKTEA